MGKIVFSFFHFLSIFLFSFFNSFIIIIKASHSSRVSHHKKNSAIRFHLVVVPINIAEWSSLMLILKRAFFLLMIFQWRVANVPFFCIRKRWKVWKEKNNYYRWCDVCERERIYRIGNQVGHSFFFFLTPVTYICLMEYKSICKFI